MTKQREGNLGRAREPVALAKIEPVQIDTGLSEVNGPALAAEPATAEESVLAFVRGLPSQLDAELGIGLGLMQIRLDGIRKEAFDKIGET